jgi:cell division septation protein DedD
MVMLFAFSLGVERGKGLVLHDPQTQVSDEKIARDDDKSVADMMVTTKGDKKTAAAAKAFIQKPDKMKAGLSDPAEKPKDKGVLIKVLAADQDSKKPAKATVVLASLPKTSGGYTVQVASYKTANGAQREAASLKQKGYSDVFILSKGKYVILCIGSFQKKEEADIFGQKKLKSRYQDLRVRSL